MAYFNIQTVKITKPNSEKKTRYRATVREKSAGKVIFNKTKTFDYKQHAARWAKELQASLEKGESPIDRETKFLTMGELINKYISKVNNSNKPLGRSAEFALKQVLAYPLASTHVVDLSSQHIVDFCYDRLNSKHKPQPQTVACDVSFIRTVLFHAKSMFGIQIDDTAIKESYSALKRLRLIGRSNQRQRRLVGNEQDFILEALKEYQTRQKVEIPYADLFEMSIITCLRISELCRLEWKHLIKDKSLIRVTDRKHPRHKKGNDMLLPLLGEGRALEIILSQPQTSEYIFPFNPKSVGTGFRRVLRSLGIEGLQYRDLRREGCSQLTEKGFSLPQVAAVSGHRDLKILHNIYVSIFPDALVHMELAKLST